LKNALFEELDEHSSVVCRNLLNFTPSNFEVRAAPNVKVVTVAEIEQKTVFTH